MVDKSTAELAARVYFSDLVAAQYVANDTRFSRRGSRPLVGEAIPLGVTVLYEDVELLDELAGPQHFRGSNRSAAARLCFQLVRALITKHTPPGASALEGFIAAHTALTQEGV